MHTQDADTWLSIGEGTGRPRNPDWQPLRGQGQGGEGAQWAWLVISAHGSVSPLAHLLVPQPQSEARTELWEGGTSPTQAPSGLLWTAASLLLHTPPGFPPFSIPQKLVKLHAG